MYCIGGNLDESQGLAVLGFIVKLGTKYLPHEWKQLSVGYPREKRLGRSSCLHTDNVKRKGILSSSCQFESAQKQKSLPSVIEVCEDQELQHSTQREDVRWMCFEYGNLSHCNIAVRIEIWVHSMTDVKVLWEDRGEIPFKNI